jgi:dipeptidyl aminopeptidase/acylaminoacyl peptidase
MNRAALAVGALLMAPPVSSQSTVDHFLQAMVTDAAVAPDGRQIAYTVRSPSSGGTGWQWNIMVMPTTGGAPLSIAPGKSPAWSPDGSVIAYITADGKQLATIGLAGGDPSVLGTFSSGIDNFRWSPDGTQLAVVAAIADSSTHFRIFTGPGGRGDRAIHLVSLSGEVRKLTDPAAFTIGPATPGLPDARQFDWLDSETLVVAGRLATSPEHRDAASLFRVGLDAAAPQYIAGKDGRWHTPVVSPDGEWIAFTGQAIQRSGYVADELVLLRPNGSGIRRLTVGLDQDVADVHWSNDNRTIWFATESRGSRNIQRVSLRSGKLEAGTTGTHLLTIADISANGFVYATRSTPTAPAGLMRFPVGKPAELAALVEYPPVSSSELEEFEYRARDGTPLQAWLVRPPDFDIQRKWPLLVAIHGGPHAMAGAGYAPGTNAAAAQGWLVLRVNPRGSTGFGADYVNGLGRDWPGMDVDDISAAIADVIQRGFADSNRVVVVGMGAGGIVAAELLGRHAGVKAAVLQCTGSGWLEGAGNYDAAPWDEWHLARPIATTAANWLAGSLLLRSVNHAKPILVVDGINDAPGSFDFGAGYFAMVADRNSNSQFVRLPGACNTAAPATEAALSDQLNRWFAKVLREAN